MSNRIELTTGVKEKLHGSRKADRVHQITSLAGSEKATRSDINYSMIMADINKENRHKFLNWKESK